MYRQRRLTFLVLLIAFACVAASAGGVRSSAAATHAVAACPAVSHPQSTFVYGVDYFAPDFDPASSYLLSEGLIWHSIYQGLTTLAPGSGSKVLPSLATSWSSNPAKSTWTFNLRHRVTFSDGTAFNAQAVKTNLVRTITLKLGTQAIVGSYLPKPSSQIEIVNPYQVKFVLSKPVPNFPVILASEWGSFMVSPKVFTEHSTGPKDQGHKWLQAHAVGTGPYIMQTFSPNDQVVLVKNPHYWGGWSGSHFSRIIIREIPEGATRRQLIQSGDLDMAFPSPNADDTVALRSNPCIRVTTDKNLEMQFIMLGDYGLLKSPKARQALEYAFPYGAYVHQIAKDTLTIAHGIFPDLLIGHDPHAYMFPTDLQKAKSLFAEAGIKPGTTLTYEYYTGYGDEAGLALQSQLSQIGIKLKIIQKDFGAFTSDVTSNRPVAKRANMFFWGWYPDYNNAADYSYPILDSASSPSVCACYNLGYYKDAAVDKAISTGFFASTPARAATIWKKVQEVTARADPAIIPVAQQDETMWARTDVVGYKASPLYVYTPNFYDLHRTS